MPSSSFFQRSCTTFVSALLLSSVSASGSHHNHQHLHRRGFPGAATQEYQLDTEYSGNSFFDGFNFFSAADPTHGFTDYVSRSDAQNLGLISTGNSAVIRVDSTNQYPVPSSEISYSDVDGVGRKSVRIESSKSWTYGLIIADIKHMPSADHDGCGTWPAFWTLGSGQWPYNGEIDIIEGANDQTETFSAGHTANQCKITPQGSGQLNYDNCNLFTTSPFGGSTNPTGCTVTAKVPNNYGAGFNANNGGVYAMEWTSNQIKTYFFPRGSIPSDISSGHPDPSKWTPFFVVGGDGQCNVDQNYRDMRIIFDTTFCGDFGSATWGNSCAAKTGYDACYKYVPGNPQAFREAYWDVPSVKVYKLKDKTVSTTTSATTSAAPTTSSTKPATSSATSSLSSSQWTSSSSDAPTTSSASSTPYVQTSSSSSAAPSSSSASTSPYLQTSSSAPASSSSSVTTPYIPTSESTTAVETTTTPYIQTSSSSSQASSSSVSLTTKASTMSAAGTTSAAPTTSSAYTTPPVSSSSVWTSSSAPASSSSAWTTSGDGWPSSSASPSSAVSSSSDSNYWGDWPSSSTMSSKKADASSSTTSDYWGDWSSSTTSSKVVVASSSVSNYWGDWPSTTSKSVVASSTTVPVIGWSDWVSTTSKKSDPITTTSVSNFWVDWESTSSKVVSVSAASSVSNYWGDWPSTTSSKPIVQTTTASYVWGDWNSASTSKPAIKASTTPPAGTWADWNSVSSSKPVVIPSTTASVSWADWVPSSSKPVSVSTSVPVSGSASWADWAASSSSKPVVSVSTSVTVSNWADWAGASTSKPVQPASTMGVPVAAASTVWQSWNGTATKPVVASYTGAGSKMGVSAIGAAMAFAGLVVLL